MMKTLSIKTDYAYYVVAGVKNVENRNWKTNYRGKLLIHASGKNLFILPSLGEKQTPLHAELEKNCKKDFDGTEKYLKLDKKTEEYYLGRS